MTSYVGTMQEYAYRDETRNSDKFYRAYTIYDPENVTDCRVLFQWGRQGAKGQSNVIVVPAIGSAQSTIRAKLGEKAGKGYQLSYGWDEPRPIAPDLLLQAGVSAGVVEALHHDPVTVLLTGIDVVRRLAMGTSADVAAAVTGRKDLDTLLNELRTTVDEAEGRLEMVDTLLRRKL